MVRLSRLRVFEERSDTMRFTSRKACLFIAAVFSLSTLSHNFLSYVGYLPLTEVPKNATYTTSTSKTAPTSSLYENYSWVGNDHWIPPRGVPHYTPQEMNELFSKINTLWIGDSNSRQAMHTMHNLMDAVATNPQDISRQQLERDINLNKFETGRVACGDRNFSNTTILGTHSDPYNFQCQDLAVDETKFVRSCFQNGSTTKVCSWKSKNNSAPLPPLASGKFDYDWINCPSDVTKLVKDELSNCGYSKTNNSTQQNVLESLLFGYDWLIIDLGIWEIQRNWVCRPNPNPTNETTVDRITTTLDWLAKLLVKNHQSTPSPDRLKNIAWVTTGSVEGMSRTSDKGQNLEAMNGAVRNWFANYRKNHTENITGMHLVDWAGQMEPRSEDDNRIRGDLPPHWGLQARLLLAQMITHLVSAVTVDP